MKSVTATITSKNQLTIPANLVRKYGLGINRLVTIREKNGSIIIEPQPPTKERLAELWAKYPPVKGALNDDELKRAIREAAANKCL